MAPEAEDNLRFEIGHVLFLDLVGYSKLLIDEQKEHLRQLTDLVLATRQVQEATNEQLVRLPTGDGMALVFRNSLEEPAQCALEISRALKAHPQIQIRMGIHSGPVSEVSDVNERTNIAGAGINLAQRVMDCGDAGHILVSRRVAEDLAEYRQWSPYLHDLGRCEVKHGLKMSISNLFGDDFGNPALPASFAGAGASTKALEKSEKKPASRSFFAELQRRNVYRAAVVYTMTSWLLIQVATQVFPFFNIANWVVRLIIVLLIVGFPIAVALAWAFEFTPHGIVKTDELPAGKTSGWPLIHRIYTGVIGVLAIAIAVLLYLRFSTTHPEQSDGIPGKSIAVLPFENYSAEKENAFFADGIQDDLLTNLAKIQALTVISRTSVMKYRNIETRDIKEIGKTLGVATILEGSVRREKDRVVVNVQLIDAERDRHLWAHRYDKTIQDSLGLEGELATEIADALRAQLTPEEKVRVAKKPTQNPDAYLHYLRALPLEQGPDTLLQDYRKAVDLYEKAIALDPAFALARAHLASTCAEIFHFHEPLDTWKNRARSEAEAALRLQPDLGEAHFALGQCTYWFDEDYERALAEFATAQRALPNDSNIGAYVAAIRRRQGRWEDALATYQRMEKLDPQNPNIIRNLVFTNTSMRRWPQAAEAAARFRAVAPESVVAKIQSGYVDFMWKGETGALQRWLAEIPPGDDPDGVVTCARWEDAMLRRDFAAADQVLVKSEQSEFSYLNGGLQPKSFLAGMTAVARGDQAAAEKNLGAALPEFEKAVQEAADAADRHANLGLVYAFMGRKTDAIREGRLAVQLKPEAKDANDGAIMLCYLALIYARVGEAEQSIKLIEQLLKTPGAVDSVDYSITRNDLKFRWEWDPLRKDERFQKLLAAPEK